MISTWQTQGKTRSTKHPVFRLCNVEYNMQPESENILFLILYHIFFIFFFMLSLYIDVHLSRSLLNNLLIIKSKILLPPSGIVDQSWYWISCSCVQTFDFDRIELDIYIFILPMNKLRRVSQYLPYGLRLRNLIEHGLPLSLQYDRLLKMNGNDS